MADKEKPDLPSKPNPELLAGHIAAALEQNRAACQHLIDGWLASQEQMYQAVHLGFSQMMERPASEQGIGAVQSSVIDIDEFSETEGASQPASPVASLPASPVSRKPNFVFHHDVEESSLPRHSKRSTTSSERGSTRSGRTHLRHGSTLAFESHPGVLGDGVFETVSSSFEQVGSRIVFGCYLRLLAFHERYGYERPHNCLSDFLASKCCEMLTGVIIAANALFMAASVDYAVEHPEDPSGSVVLSNIELGFTIFYTLELVLRVVGEGWHFLCSDSARYNLLDSVVVAFALYDFLATYVDLDGLNFGFLRLLRLAKLVRMLKVVRVMRTFRDLRLLISGILGSMKAMAWSVVLIAIITYMFAIFFLQSASDLLADAKDKDEFLQYWGSTSKAMLSLYWASTGGDSWRYVADPLWDLGWFLYLAFLVYVAFFMFVIVNTVTSIFVSSMMENAERDTQAMIQDELTKMEGYKTQLTHLFKTIDQSGEGIIRRRDFIGKMNSPKMLAFLNTLDIDTVDARRFFDILCSANGEETIDVETFVAGCLQMRGPARSMDVLGMFSAVLRIDSHFDRLEKLIKERNGYMKPYNNHNSHNHQAHVKYKMVTEGSATELVMPEM